MLLPPKDSPSVPVYIHHKGFFNHYARMDGTAMHHQSYGVDPNLLTDDERFDEIASILASGILRLRIKKAQQLGKTESFCLDKGNRMAPHDTLNHIDIKREKS